MKTLGLMSGTSFDGIDVVALDTDGESVSAFGPQLGMPYEPELRARIRAALGSEAPLPDLEEAVTVAHAEAVIRLFDAYGLTARDVDLIGFHGQTILHAPERRLTRQIGDGALLARLVGVNVVADFRAADVAAGGQGAPLVPLYNQALARDLAGPLAVLNIGGVANVTWLGEKDAILAFDTGPGNALLDDWVFRHKGMAFDRGGTLASVGRVHEERLERALARRFFVRPPPKSLDRNAFDDVDLEGLSPEDGAATLVEFTARAVKLAMAHMPQVPRRWLVCGGGRHNPAIMAALRRHVGAPVDPVEAVGWRGDALEAEAFAFLAVRSILGRPLSLPATTGVPRPLTGGRIFRAN